MKKLFTLMLAVMLVLSMATVASAEYANPGIIEISKVAVQNTATDGQPAEYEPVSEFKAYRILDLGQYDAATDKYNYTVTAEWAAFLEMPEVKEYLLVNTNGYVEWKSVENEDLDARAAELSKLAMQYVTNHPGLAFESTTVFVENSAVTDAEGNVTGTIQLVDLPLGYYLIDSTAGALCGLNTTNPMVSFEAKNVPPTVQKQVKEDDITSGSNWGSESSAMIGQTVQFDATITIHAGAENYVLHDDMSESLTFVKIDSITHQSGTHNEPLDETYYTVKTGDATVGATCDFEIVFTDDFYTHVKPGDRVVVLYSAMLNEKAAQTPDLNENEVWVTYGNNSTSTHDTTNTKTYSFDLVKVTSDREFLNGANFEVYATNEDAVAGTNKLSFVAINPITVTRPTTPTETTLNVPVYRVAKPGETGVTTLEVTNGYIRIIGMDSDTYYLKETKAPDNYNQLKNPVEFSLDNGNAHLTFNSTGGLNTNSGVQVVNNTGKLLPDTGGMGTTLFITLGAVVVIATGLLLVTKKRMSMIR